jgi:hypothetical protein
MAPWMIQEYSQRLGFASAEWKMVKKKKKKMKKIDDVVQT